MSKPVEVKRATPPLRFRTERQERAYWEAHDSSALIDWSRAQSVQLPRLKPTSTSISLRLPISLLNAK